MRIKQQWYAREFTLGHQKVFVDLDFEEQAIEGWTEISIIPLSTSLDSAAFHCWQSEITHCEVEGQGAAWQHIDGLRDLQLKERSATVHQHESLRTKFSTLNRTINKCDLHIRFPNGVKVTEQDRLGQNTHDVQDNGVVDNLGDMEGHTPAVMPTPMTPFDFTPAANGTRTQYKPINVKIWFTCKKPIFGLRFVNAVDSHQYPHAYTTNHPLACSTSLWLPCLDGIWERCTWEISISVPKTLGDIKSRGSMGQKSLHYSKSASFSSKHDIDSRADTDDLLEMLVVCSADLIEEMTDANDHSRKIVSFAQGSPIGASHIGFTVGPFEKLNLTDLRETDEDDLMGSSAVDVIAYCLPGKADMMQNTFYFAYKAIDYFVKEFGSYPYTDYSVCFVQDLEVDQTSLSSMSLVAENLLIEESTIDSIYSVSCLLTYSLACQWIGVNIVPRSWSDLWLTIGIGHYISGLFLRQLMGNNEYRFRLKQNAVRITELDLGRPPISSRELDVPIDPEQLSFIKLKAPMVLHMLEQRMTKSGSTLGLQRVIPKIFLQALSGELPNGILSAAQFLRQCEKVAHVKLEDFSRQWITGYGYPKFSVVQRYNKKKMVIEMGIRQQQFAESTRTPPQDASFVDDAYRSLTKPPVGPVEAIFKGPITVRIHEADGTPLEHVIDLKEQYHKFDIPYNNKYRRRVRNKIRNKARMDNDSAQAPRDAEDDEEIEQVQINCLGDNFQSEQDLANWELEDWTKEDEDRIAGEAFEWLRLDAEFEWICTMQIGQPDYMYQSQLQQDRDVVAQFEAMQYFGSVPPTKILATTLFRTIMDERYFYGIRQMAARALAKCAIPEIDMRGERLLLGIFKHRYCYSDSTDYIPRANDFSDFADYFLRISMLEALQEIHATTSSMVAVRSMLLQQLRYNDNTNNLYDDTEYVGALLRNITSSFINQIATSKDFSQDSDFRESLIKALEEIERCQRMDRWRPSPQNKTTRVVLACKERLMSAGLLPVGLQEYMEYSSEEHPSLVRLQAFQSLLRLGALRHAPMIRYIFFTLTHDPSSHVKKALGLLIKHGFGTMAISSRAGTSLMPLDVAGTDAMIVEDDTTAAVELRKDREARQTIDGAILALREDVGDDEVLKKYLWKAVNDIHLDPLVRRDLLYVCRILYESKLSRILKFKFPRLKARLVCQRIKGDAPGRLVIKKGRPFERYQKKAPVKIKLKLFNHIKKESNLGNT